MYKRKIILKPRFFIILILLMIAITINIIFNLAKEFENMKVINEVSASTLLAMEKDISEVSIKEIAKPRYGFTNEEIYLLAQVLSGDESIDGDGEYDIDFQQEINYYEVSKVLGVIMNRVRSDKFPNNVTDVIKQKGQFSVIPRNLTSKPSDISLLTVRKWCMAYDSYINFIQVIPKDDLFFTGNGVVNITKKKYK